MTNVGFVWPGMKKLTAKEAKERMLTNDSVYELFDDNTFKKCTINDFSIKKIYGVMYDNDFSLETHFLNEYRVMGRVLFCKQTRSFETKLQIAYDWLAYICLDLSGDRKKKCCRLLSDISGALIKKQNGISKRKNDLLIRLWHEVQIFFQEVCPTNWYFVKKDNETYLFIYIA